MKLHEARCSAYGQGYIEQSRYISRNSHSDVQPSYQKYRDTRGPQRSNSVNSVLDTSTALQNAFKSKTWHKSSFHDPQAADKLTQSEIQHQGPASEVQMRNLEDQAAQATSNLNSGRNEARVARVIALRTQQQAFQSGQKLTRSLQQPELRAFPGHELATSSSTSGAGTYSKYPLQSGDTLRSIEESQKAAAAKAEKDAKEKEELERAKAHIREAVLPEVFMVDSLHEAERICRLLMSKGNRQRVYACDTEVAFIDVSKQSPCGHGKVICFSVYGGDDLHFGIHSPQDGLQNLLWVDTFFDEEQGGEGPGILEAFKPFFEASGIRKVWHNYSFDRHVLANMGIHCQGFAGDTMHMARLYDSSRRGTKSYSLASLSKDSKVMEGFQDADDAVRGKISMKELFGRRNITKDGKPGKLVTVPPVEKLHLEEESRDGWINYSALDAKATWQLRKALEAKLAAAACEMDAAVQEALGSREESLWDLYCRFWLPFGELLTDMEKQGILVNRDHLAAAQEKALVDQRDASLRFREWAQRKVPDAAHMNVGSGLQIRQLLFSGAPNAHSGKDEQLELERVFKAPNVAGVIEEGRKVAKKHVDITLWGLWGRSQPSDLTAEVFTPNGWPAVSTPVLRSLAGTPGAAKQELARRRGLDTAASSQEPTVSDVASFAEDVAPVGEALLDSKEAEEEEEDWSTSWLEIKSTNGAVGSAAKSPKKTKAGRNSGQMGIISTAELNEAAAKSGFGRLFSVFGGGIAGLEACAAVDALCEVGAIDTLLSNFIVPLQEEHIATRNPDGTLGRVHCSLNINTETGRLSARRPNLQNQPALEKDRYKVRQAFTADVAASRTLVVADYGQLELRLLAHMTNCKSMLAAFAAGGDFHSRTALGMYDHIRDAVDQGECLLEWDGPQGEKPPAPLLKDRFASERRRAKVLNFSIAYGKTAHGLSKDWKVDLQEATDTVDRWYSDRPEVLKWQKKQKKQAEEKGYVQTILGRRRQLPDAASGGAKAKAHALRAAINTPIQGSAADVATAAMLAIHSCPRLRALGWTLLLQVHDEVILEGPKESAAEAKALVVHHMGNPFQGSNPLRVALCVDAKSADTWYQAK